MTGVQTCALPISPIDEAPKKAAPATPPKDVDEGFETLDESPAPAAAAKPAAPAAKPAAPAPAKPAGKGGAAKPKGGSGDFEELEEWPDAVLLDQMMAPGHVNQVAGMVRLDAQGGIVWSGDVLLPTVHRRY